MVFNEERDCVGSATVPLHLGHETDAEGNETGLCPICFARLALTPDGLMPAHKPAEREIGQLPPY